jgi:glucan phosphoethanolaminetransferase (alkaline phosphatase superfamily)
MSFIDITTASLITRLGKAVFRGSTKIKILFVLAVILILIAMVLTSLVDAAFLPRYINILAAILGVLGGICILGIYAYQSNLEDNEAKEEIRKVENRAKENPNEPTAAWDLARIKLENYLNRNLTQIQWIFIWTVIVMIAGFGIISYGIMRAYDANVTIHASLITTASGLLVEFIGATFLVIYKSTMEQAKDYVNVLERINAVGMSVQILDSISKDETKLQDQTRAEIAKQLLALYSIKP